MSKVWEDVPMTVDLLLAIIREKIADLEYKEWTDWNDKIIVLKQILEEYEKRKGGGKEK